MRDHIKLRALSALVQMCAADFATGWANRDLSSRKLVAHYMTMSIERLSRSSPSNIAPWVSNSSDACVFFYLRCLASLKALRIINEEEDEELQSLDEAPEDTMTTDELRQALRRARRVGPVLSRLKLSTC
jgi:hypothetical protein